MKYDFLDKSIDTENIILPESDKINKYLLKSNQSEIIKSIDFLASDDKFLYIHGFLGTGKRQIINYVAEFTDKNVITLEYYCKPSTVSDDILLNFIEKIEKNNLAKAVNLNVKISTLAVKFQQYISSIKKPFLIILHSFDDVAESNLKLIQDCFSESLKNPNVKIILSSRGLKQDILGEVKFDRNIFLKAFSKEIFKEFMDSNNISCNDKLIEDFYKCTRGYYYYTALSIKILQAMNLTVSEFLEKFKLSGMTFDTYLGTTYLNLIPQAIHNFFWFLRTLRHGVSLNALAVWDLYDEFSINYLKTNLMIFEADETLYVQDYFQQNIDISIPEKTEIRLHKYIVGIYEKELKETLQTRSIMISRQALRAEIEYHQNRMEELKNGNQANTSNTVQEEQSQLKKNTPVIAEGLENQLKEAQEYFDKENYTKAIETYLKIIETETLDSIMLNEIRHKLGILYKNIADFSKAQHYYELVEKYFKCNNEIINLNYLYYEITELYQAMYKNERAIETIKKVIYSVDTPQSLMVNACTLLGNIYSEMNNTDDAYAYYQKALDSLDENTPDANLAELYFKYALVNDDRGDTSKAFEFYNKCIQINDNKYKSSAYSNLGSCYFENNNLSDAKACFLKAYKLEKAENNFDGIYYTSINLAKVLTEDKSPDALKYLTEAKQSAEFLNENSYLLEVSILMGDYYYDKPDKLKNALTEYLRGKAAAENIPNADISKIEKRIKDMKLRMNENEFKEIISIYEK